MSLYKAAQWKETGPESWMTLSGSHTKFMAKQVLCEFYLKGSELKLIKFKGFTYFFLYIMFLESCSYHCWLAEQILIAQCRGKESKA